MQEISDETNCGWSKADWMTDLKIISNGTSGRTDLYFRKKGYTWVAKWPIAQPGADYGTSPIYANVNLQLTTDTSLVVGRACRRECKQKGSPSTRNMPCVGRIYIGEWSRRM